MTQLLRVVGLSPVAPTKEEGLCLLSTSETGNWERVSGSGPRKEARPSSLPTGHRTILISSPRPRSPVWDPRGNEAAGRNVVRRL